MKKLYTTLVIALISINSFGQAPNWVWAKNAVGTGQDVGNSIAVDATGNTFIAGRFDSPTITFGTITLTNSAYPDIFIAKYDANGNVIWAKSAGGTGYDEVNSIITDATGDVYITGYFRSSTMTFGTTTLTNNSSIGYSDIFIAKYDANGNLVWAKSVGGTNNDYGSSIATDAIGNTYLTGAFQSPVITFGAMTLTNNGAYNIFIVKYDTNGNVVWAKSAGGTYDNSGKSIVTDAAGNTTITGYFSSPTITFGATTLTNGVIFGDPDIFIAKYDTNGNVLWAKSASGNNDFAEGYSISNDASGNTIITGFFSSTIITFGTTTLTNNAGINGSSDTFIAKYDTNGNMLWAKSAGGNSGDKGYSIATDAAGNSYLTGDFMSPTITFGTTTLTNNGGYDIFVAKYDTDGNVIWAKSAGGTGSDNGHSIATDAAGNTYIAGTFQSPTLTFGSTTLTNNGSYDIFIAKLDGTTGIAEIENGETVLLAPNPTTSHTTITFNEAQKNTSIKVMNTLGECIQQLTTSNQQLTLDMSGYAKGVYFVKIESSPSLSQPEGETKPMYKKLVLQ